MIGTVTMPSRTPARHDVHWAKFFHVVVRSGAWAELSSKAKAVYPVLLAHVEDRTRNCWPSNARIAREAGLHLKSVPAATAELVAQCVLKKWRKDRKNFYHLYTEEEFMPLPRETTCHPAPMDTRSVVRARDAHGRFLPPAMVAPAVPAVIEAEPPMAMAFKKNERRKVSEEESASLLAAGSASAGCGHASPAPAKRPRLLPLIDNRTLSALYRAHGFAELPALLARYGCASAEVAQVREADLRALEPTPSTTLSKSTPNGEKSLIIYLTKYK